MPFDNFIDLDLKMTSPPGVVCDTHTEKTTAGINQISIANNKRNILDVLFDILRDAVKVKQRSNVEKAQLG